MCAGLALALLTAWAPASSDPSDSAEDDASNTDSVSPDGRAAVAVLESGHANAVHFSSPKELVEQGHSPVALVGRITGVAEGHSVLDYNTDVGYFETAERFVVFEVTADRLFWGEEYLLDGNRAFVSRSRGLEMLGPDGEVADPRTSMVRPLSVYEDAFPVGTRVVVISAPKRDSEVEDSPATKMVDATKGVPDGGTLLWGGHPQIFSVVTDDNAVSGWGLSYDELLAGLEALDG